MPERVSIEELATGNLIRTQLLPNERDLFSRWFRRFGKDYTDYEFAITVGPGQPIPPEVAPGIATLIERVTRLRIDFAARDAGGWTIFEIKERVRIGTTGQLMAYADFWREEFPDRPIKELAVITDFVDNNNAEVFRRRGIKVIIV